MTDKLEQDLPEGGRAQDHGSYELSRRIVEHWREIVGALVFLALLFVVARSLALTIADSQSTVVSAQHRMQVGPEGSGVRIVGWLDQDRAVKGFPVQVRFAFLNDSATEVLIRFDLFAAPGFSPSQQSGGNQDFVVRVGGETSEVRCLDRVISVPPEGRTTARVPIVPAAGAGSSMITALFSWQDPQRGRLEAALDLGPIRSTSPVRLFVTHALESGQQLAQALAIPFALAVVGWFLQGIHQDHVQERQAWVSMLPVSHDNNVKIYLPPIAAAREVQSCLDRGAPEEAFLALLLFLRRLREVGKAGLYLRSRTGEKMVKSSWELFVARARTELPGVSEVLDCVRPRDNVHGLARRLTRQPELQAKRESLQSKFAAWVKQSPADFALLSLFADLFHFEINRIYKFWYGDEPEFPFEPCKAHLAKLDERCSDFKLQVTRHMETFRRPARGQE